LLNIKIRNILKKIKMNNLFIKLNILIDLSKIILGYLTTNHKILLNKESKNI